MSEEEGLPKFPKPYEGNKSRWSSRYEHWCMNMVAKLQKRYQELGKVKPDWSLDSCIRSHEKLEMIIIEVLESLK